MLYQSMSKKGKRAVCFCLKRHKIAEEGKKGKADKTPEKSKLRLKFICHESIHGMTY